MRPIRPLRAGAKAEGLIEVRGRRIVRAQAEVTEPTVSGLDDMCHQRPSHPEATVDIVEGWARADGGAAGGRAGEAAAFRLFGAFADQIPNRLAA